MAWRNFFFLIFSFFVFNLSVAQNRVIVNPSFEPPFTPFVKESSRMVNGANSSVAQIKGWCTTASDFQIEIWQEGMEGFKAPSGFGKQWVELNANLISRLYQTICLVKGETITWSYYHRGRESTSLPDEMELNIYSITGEKLATLQKASTTNTDWKKYTGTYKVDLPNGSYQISFEAIRSGLGNSTVGNFIDGVSIGLFPMIQFSSNYYSGFESSSRNVPRLIVNGTIPHGGAEVTVEVEKDNAVFREDYLFPITFTIPPGVYTPSTIQIIPLTIINDNIPEEDETIRLKLAKTTGNLRIMDAECDGIFFNTASYTIIDDDTANRSSKPITAVFNNKKIAARDTVNLNILFEQGADVIAHASEVELQELLNFMRTNSHAEIGLEGHTERDEENYTQRQIELNQLLSEKRVTKIKNYLISNGIEDVRIKTAAYGGKKAISSDPAKNRRVVMRVLKL